MKTKIKERREKEAAYLLLQREALLSDGSFLGSTMKTEKGDGLDRCRCSFACRIH
jgi:hypothetical protein